MHDSSQPNDNDNRWNDLDSQKRAIAKQIEFYQKQQAANPAAMQQFTTGATRSADDGKIDYDGFLSPRALEAYGAYMLKHQKQADGKLRESDNWQKGMPVTGKGSYMKAFIRHALELWGLSRGHVSERLRREMPGASQNEMMHDSACACFFNIQGFLHESTKPILFVNQSLAPSVFLGGAGLGPVADYKNKP